MHHAGLRRWLLHEQELGRAAISGFTNDKQFNSSAAIGPLMKHYLAYSAPEGGHNTAPAHVGRREVLSTFMPPFSAGMEAGAQALMVSCASATTPRSPLPSLSLCSRRV